jgi:glutathione synthase/RimK-type ligase-like ATP-grasp enzyme
MKYCAILTTDNLEDYFVYDQMLTEPLRLQGWMTEEVSWRKKDVDWDQYDVVIIRSTWDYQQDAEAFLDCLRKIEVSSAKLENSLKIVEWNISKKYLQELQKQGVSIVPTLWFDSFDYKTVFESFAYFSAHEVVIKPLVSAGADFTYRLTEHKLLELKTELTEVFSSREFMVQPFLKSVVEEGEYSLFYFSGDFSHAILKQPKSGDFRVQEEHGGQLTSIQPTEPMLTTARHCLAALPEDVFYARVDLIRHNNEFVLIEIELIEPSLYFNMDPASAQRFVDAFVEQFGKG